jgi:predicted MFS family arabinose efflux permease
MVLIQSKECSISRQYLCQASLLITGISTLAFTAVEGYSGYVIFIWVYGLFYGGFNYCLKMYVYEKVRARNFARAWGFVQFSMAIPNFIGIPLSGKKDA